MGDCEAVNMKYKKEFPQGGNFKLLVKQRIKKESDLFNERGKLAFPLGYFMKSGTVPHNSGRLVNLDK